MLCQHVKAGEELQVNSGKLRYKINKWNASTKKGSIPRAHLLGLPKWGRCSGITLWLGFGGEFVGWVGVRETLLQCFFFLFFTFFVCDCRAENFCAHKMNKIVTVCDERQNCKNNQLNKPKSQRKNNNEKTTGTTTKAVQSKANQKKK